MDPLTIQTAVDQVTQHLREQIRGGVWTRTIPGGEKLSRNLSVGRMTVETALRNLEKEGLLQAHGPGRQRTINQEALAGQTTSSLRIGLLPYEPRDLEMPHTVELRSALQKAGHILQIAPNSSSKLGYVTERVKRMVRKMDVDCWIVFAGSKELLDWFSSQPIPSFAFFGRRHSCEIAGVGPDLLKPYKSIINRLTGLGHQRIVLLARKERHLPSPGYIESQFLTELESVGIPIGAYNYPLWEDHPEGFRDCLESLFKSTPPTALIFQEEALFFAAQPILSRMSLKIPEDVSLCCTTDSPLFAWQQPSVAHVTWDHKAASRRVIRWVDNVAKGKRDLRQNLTKAEFVDGGTIGPAKPHHG